MGIQTSPVTPHQTYATVAHADILTLPTTPVEIIPAQGANTLILPMFGLCRMKWVADYTTIGPTCALKLDISGSFLAALFESTLGGVSQLLAGGGPDGTWVCFTINQLAQSKVTSATPSIDPHYHQGAVDSSWYDSDLLNVPLTLHAESNSGGDFTDGNAGNELQFWIWWSKITVTNP